MRLALALVCVAAATAQASSGQLPAHAGMYVLGASQPVATPAAALVMMDSRVDVTVRGAVAEIVVHQTFHNDADHVTEATYIFPLPEDAAVTAMAITAGDRTIHAAIAARADAQKRYEDAVTAGIGAALLEEERPDVFTQTVSAIPAGGDVEVSLRYDTVARPRGDGSWQLVLPMVVAPRYVAGTASGRPTTGAGHAPDTDRAPDASRVTPGGKPNAGGATAIALSFADPIDEVTSPTHELAARGAGYALADAHSDHDAVIRWRAKQPDSGWVEQDDDGGYAAAVVSAPPAKARAAGAAAVDLTLILDRSAAAHGDADATARPLVRELLAQLTPADAVTVLGSSAVARQAPLDAWRELDRAWSASPGAFDLTRALHAAHGGGAIVLVTPGLVADDAAALAAARALKTPIHVLGVGPAPNRALLVAIAQATGGTVRFAAPDDDAGALARDLVADVASPPAALTISWGVLTASDVVPATLPRLGAGQARLVLARVPRAVAANGRARGDVFAIAMMAKEPAQLGATTPRGPLARRWAADKLGELLAAPRVDATAATALALRYGLLSPYTSMIAIGDEVVVRGGVKHTVAVPVSVPAGMRWQPVERELHVVTKGELDANAPAKDGKKAERPADKNLETLETEGNEAKHKSKPPTVVAKPPPQAPPPSHHTPRPTPTPDTPAPAGAPAAPQRQPEPEPSAQRAGRDDDGDGVSDARAPAEDEEARPKQKVATAEDASQLDDTGDDFRAPQRLRRETRLGLALGGGLTLTDPTGLVTLTARTELRAPGNRAVPTIGVEGALWLVAGLHAQERLLATFAWRTGRLELGFGLGLHVADGDGLEAGPAAGLVGRYALTRDWSLYLRYDGALLLHGDGGTSGEHAATAGVERRW